MKIKYQEIVLAKKLFLKGEVDSSFLELEEIHAEPVGKFFYSLELELIENTLFVQGNLFQKVNLICVICLESFDQDIATTFNFNDSFIQKPIFDLTPFIREDIHLALPNYPHCDGRNGKSCVLPNFETVDKNFSHQQNVNIQLSSHPRKNLFSHFIWSELDKLKTLPSDGSS